MKSSPRVNSKHMRKNMIISILKNELLVTQLRQLPSPNSAEIGDSTSGNREFIDVYKEHRQSKGGLVYSKQMTREPAGCIILSQILAPLNALGQWWATFL